MHALRNYDEWEASLRNFDFLEGVVPGGMDVDWLGTSAEEGQTITQPPLLVHKGRGQDRFLLIENKRAGERLTKGQYIALAALQKLPEFTVIVAYGPDSAGRFLLSWDRKGFYTKEEFAALVREWWDER